MAVGEEGAARVRAIPSAARSGWRWGRRARRTRAIAAAAPSRRGRAAAVRRAVLVVVVASAASGRDAARAPIPRAVVAAPAATKTDPRPTAPTTTARETPSLARCGSREIPFATVMIHRATHIVRNDDDDSSRETSCDRVIVRAPTAGATLSARPAAERRPRRGGDADADGVRRGLWWRVASLKGRVSTRRSGSRLSTAN